MKKIFVIVFLIALMPKMVLAQGGEGLQRFTIFSGDKRASFFSAASAVCDVFNRHYGKNGYECVAFESKGSESSLQSLANEEADFAVVKTEELNKIFLI